MYLLINFKITLVKFNINITNIFFFMKKITFSKLKNFSKSGIILWLCESL